MQINSVFLNLNVTYLFAASLSVVNDDYAVLPDPKLWLISLNLSGSWIHVAQFLVAREGIEFILM